MERGALVTMDDPPRILFVCHANLCRSPLAERLARQLLEKRLGVPALATVSSAGSHAEPDRPMHPHAETVLSERGADVSGFRSRRLTGELVRQADLVLTAARDQRATCVTLAPTAVRRTFTLRQFGRLAGGYPAEQLPSELPVRERLLVVRDGMGDLRARLPIPAGDADDLDDPVRGPIADFEDCADEISRALTVIVDLIVPFSGD
jgi:protein-tyrosine phosphatase